MRIHYLQHVPFEGLGNIENWALAKGHQISDTQLYNNDPLPEPEEFDWLIVMGGPMNIYEEDRFPWLAREKVFIKDAIDSDRIVLGVCLGAQLIASVLGAKIYRNRYPEIRWFDVRLTCAASKSQVFRQLPERFTAFHWHGDTYDLPPGATRIAESDACQNQAFEYGSRSRVIGLQFHLDTTFESIRQLVEHCGDELIPGEYVQDRDELLMQCRNLDDLRGYSEMLLDCVEGEYEGVCEDD
ncbi:MAG: Glutamine amidotransferase class-I [Candidatus Argoarchaeum ethanivorans]|uniref:Glutamine amidotransferase class-I n=1 Tax=Candidatus Argoarchaeum ethanivorans TaxID=2608793 RepID=A0A811T7Q7_9EURY|nr:MAG: Glutamine amidotransferase class-I [Candidatus Argoarchaeum ethanivorans]